MSKSHMKGMSDISQKKALRCRKVIVAIPMVGLYEERLVIMKLKSSTVLTFYPTVVYDFY